MLTQSNNEILIVYTANKSCQC